MNITIQHKRILLAPLDWGLGHATRCIPLLHWLLANSNDITIACNAAQKAIFLKEFKCINFLELRGYEIRYATRKRLLPFVIISQIPKILFRIYKEHRWLQNILQDNSFDIILSDNRYGLYTNQAYTIFITHQLQIQTPKFFTRIVQVINYSFINRFNTCWVPDYGEWPGLAGSLSHPKVLPKIPIHYIGPLTRIKPLEKMGIVYKWLLILSGPEPQRTILETKLLIWMRTHTQPCVLLRGIPNPTHTQYIHVPAHCSVINYASTEEIEHLLQISKYLISRSGYTTIMEMINTGMNCIFIPTPAQTEQEYLAANLMQQNLCFSFSQDDDFETMLLAAEKYFQKKDIIA